MVEDNRYKQKHWGSIERRNASEVYIKRGWISMPHPDSGTKRLCHLQADRPAVRTDAAGLNVGQSFLRDAISGRAELGDDGSGLIDASRTGQPTGMFTAAIDIDAGNAIEHFGHELRIETQAS